MKPINIYSLTRIEDLKYIAAYERQLSGRKYFLDVKDREIDGLRKLADTLCEKMSQGFMIDFFYSFQIPKLGKEFDLLRIANGSIVNIELKSGDVTQNRIKRQLEQNRYYLSTLGVNIKSYTYVSNEDRLYRLTSGGNLVESDFGRLCDDLSAQEVCYQDNIEDLFKEENFLVSPLTDPERFLLGEYFLTAQQNDIKKNILEGIKSGDEMFHGFYGLPGTGKTLLLYDLAMRLSVKQKVCVLHFGSFPDELRYLDERLKRIDFFHMIDNDVVDYLDDYSVIFIDEGHRMNNEFFLRISDYAKRRNIPIIISFDKEDVLATSERPMIFVDNEKLGQLVRTYKLTNRIRLNSELSNFIHVLVNNRYKNHKSQYPSVAVSYANNAEEVINLIKYYENKGYVYICNEEYVSLDSTNGYEIKADDATCREFDKVLMIIDSSTMYNDEGYLISRDCENERQENSRVRKIFHGLNRAKSNIALIVNNNDDVFIALMNILHKQK